LGRKTWFEKPGGVPSFDKRVLAGKAARGYQGRAAVVRQKDGTLKREEAGGWAAKNALRHRGTLWEYGAIGGQRFSAASASTGHPARFAEAFARDAVLCFSRPGDLVVDPFVGSGTVAVAAVRHNRTFLGGDISPRWAAVARRVARLEEDALGQDAPLSRDGTHQEPLFKAAKEKP